ncbi:hypothetical protein CK203_093010 [Vitis vinifera]|uniref:C2 domain-containing protein n=1 Tax=Vitis vinifera TaxID=29760 RepID=A0A438DFS4_VITVI|nr:hypothetical protein CK203_093010 [Vitis vinifera]
MFLGELFGRKFKLWTSLEKEGRILASRCCFCKEEEELTDNFLIHRGMASVCGPHYLHYLFCCCCSSMVPGSRNPMWGEEFNFSVDDLPVKVAL